MRIYDIYNKIFFMKNLFVITEEEKNRILGLHEQATKNNYYYNRDLVGGNPSPENRMTPEWEIAHKLNNAARGAGTDEETFTKIIENINSPEELIEINNKLKRTGERFDLEGLINDEFNPQEYGDRSYLDRIKAKLSSLGAQLTYTQTINGSVKIILPSVQEKPEDVNAQTLKHAQDCGWGNDVEGYRNSGWVCPKPGSTGGSTGGNTKGSTGGTTQPSPNVTRIKELQTKVGVEKVDGILGPKTLKAIMDKLSQ